MAEYGIVMKIAEIQGNINLDGFVEAIGVTSVQFSAGASSAPSPDATAKSSATVSSVDVTFQASKWTAELLQACEAIKVFPKVEIMQLAQAVDAAGMAKPSTLQKLTLTNAVLVAVSNTWNPGATDREAAISFEFDKLLYEVGTKPADFTVRNVTEKAV